MAGPLEGIRVLDLTSVVLGPYATQMLGDMGADVIKIEPPQGDITRNNGPSRNRNMSGLFLGLNRNKRSVCLDLKSAGGKQALMKMLPDADIFIHNMRADAVRRLGLDAASVRNVNPRLVYCSAYGFSERGPYAGRPAYDDVIQAASGLAHLQSVAGTPHFINTTIADKVVGLNVVSAALAALIRRGRTGRGETIEVPMFECMVSFVLGEHLQAANFEPPLGPPGYTRVMDPDRRPYRTSDGHIAVIPYNLASWQNLFKLVGREGLITDPRFASEADIEAHFGALCTALDEAMSVRSTSEWMIVLQENDLAAMQVNSLDEVFTDPHLAEIGFFSFQDHPTEGKLRTPGIPVSFEEAPGSIRLPAPHIGEHTVEVLKEAGMAAAAIEQLLSQGAASDGRVQNTDVSGIHRQ